MSCVCEGIDLNTEDEVDDVSEDKEDSMAVASNNLETINFPNKPHKSQVTWTRPKLPKGREYANLCEFKVASLAHRQRFTLLSIVKAR